MTALHQGIGLLSVPSLHTVHVPARVANICSAGEGRGFHATAAAEGPPDEDTGWEGLHGHLDPAGAQPEGPGSMDTEREVHHSGGGQEAPPPQPHSASMHHREGGECLLSPVFGFIVGVLNRFLSFLMVYFKFVCHKLGYFTTSCSRAAAGASGCCRWVCLKGYSTCKDT